MLSVILQPSASSASSRRRLTSRNGSESRTRPPGARLDSKIRRRCGCYPATAVALEETLCVVVSQEALGAAIAADPRLAFVLLARLARRVRELIERLDRRTTGSVRSRLAEYLLERARATASTELTLGGSQAAVAEELGTVREVLVRELRRLREAGVVRSRGRGRLTLGDPGALRRIALNQQERGEGEA